MAKGSYIGVSAVARKIKKMYIGVGGVAHAVKKAYIGVNGVARLWWSGEVTPVTLTCDNYTSSSSSSSTMYRSTQAAPTSFSSITNPLTSADGIGSWVLYDPVNERFVLVAGQSYGYYVSITSKVYTMPVDSTTWTYRGTTGAAYLYYKPQIDEATGELLTTHHHERTRSGLQEYRYYLTKGVIGSSSITTTQKTFDDYNSSIWSVKYPLRKVGDYYVFIYSQSSYYYLYYCSTIDGTWTTKSISMSYSGQSPVWFDVSYINGNYTISLGNYKYVDVYTGTTIANVARGNTVSLQITVGSQSGTLPETTPMKYGTKIVFSGNGVGSGSGYLNATAYIDLSASTIAITKSMDSGVNMKTTGVSGVGNVGDCDFDENRLFAISTSYRSAVSTYVPRIAYIASSLSSAWTLITPSTNYQVRIARARNQV